VEQEQLGPVPAGDLRELFLGLVELPARSEDASILATVGVADHDFLEISLLFPHRGVSAVLEQPREDLGRPP
jgi:hypothetical protein